MMQLLFSPFPSIQSEKKENEIDLEEAGDKGEENEG